MEGVWGRKAAIAGNLTYAKLPLWHRDDMFWHSTETTQNQLWRSAVTKGSQCYIC
jgi:hypothetical protein